MVQASAYSRAPRQFESLYRHSLMFLVGVKGTALARCLSQESPAADFNRASGLRD